MVFRRIFGPAFIESGPLGEEAIIKLDPTPGGRACKVVNYQVKFIQTGGDSALRFELELRHGPDGTISTLHSTPIQYSSLGPVPELKSGDADQTKIIGEYLHPVIKIKANAGSTVKQTATIEVFELRKPF